MLSAPRTSHRDRVLMNHTIDSFKIISAIALPSINPIRLHVDHSYRGPLVLFPFVGSIKALKLTEMEPLDRGSCPEVYKPVPIYLMHSMKSDAFWEIVPRGEAAGLEACTMREDGGLLIGVGPRETINIWRPNPKQTTAQEDINAQETI